jgi:hypothetical protein
MNIGRQWRRIGRAEAIHPGAGAALRVECLIDFSAGQYRTTIVETDEQFDPGTARIVALHAELDDCVRIANRRAQQAGIDAALMVQALSTAHAEAADVAPEC